MTDYTLYLVLNRESLPDERLLSVARSAVAGGVSLVQWRDKTNRPAGALLQELHSFLRSVDIPLIINDDASLAHSIGAEGVHLGQGDGDPVAARALLGPRAILGRSVSDEAQLRRVASQPIDYVGIGPAYATATKANHAEPLGVTGIARLRRQIAHLPAVAIGGIDARRAGPLMSAGVNGLAVVSAICAAADPEGAARELVAIVKQTG